MSRVKKVLPLLVAMVLLVLVASPVFAQLQGTPYPLENRIAEGINFENLFAYTPIQHDVASHVLTLGYAAQAAGLVYFLASMSNVAPRYRLSSILSAVVMTSATLELFQLWQNWNETFEFADGLWVPTTTAFSNGFRYMNWSIDVPMLLLQLVVVLGLTRAQAVSYGTKFIIGGLLMIWTGYIGQFYEVTNAAPFWIWGAVSTVFYVYVLYVIGQMIAKNAGLLPTQPDDLPKAMKGVFWFILITWTLYPIAYLMPVLWPAAWGAVTRQVIYTIADITSKVIYGAILSYIARKRSEALEFEPAIATSRR
jgi:bacteriorhodopsin